MNLKLSILPRVTFYDYTTEIFEREKNSTMKIFRDYFSMIYKFFYRNGRIKSSSKESSSKNFEHRENEIGVAIISKFQISRLIIIYGSPIHSYVRKM